MSMPCPDKGPVPEPVAALARFLFWEAGSNSVRTREALAATIVNQARRLRRAGEGGIIHLAKAPCHEDVAFLVAEVLARLPMVEAAWPRSDDPLYASCCRIAKRAITGALHDPTAGAVRFQKVGESPDASSAGSQSWIGPYLFYAEDETSADPVGTSHTGM